MPAGHRTIDDELQSSVLELRGLRHVVIINYGTVIILPVL